MVREQTQASVGPVVLEGLAGRPVAAGSMRHPNRGRLAARTDFLVRAQSGDSHQAVGSPETPSSGDGPSPDPMSGPEAYSAAFPMTAWFWPHPRARPHHGDPPNCRERPECGGTLGPGIPGSDLSSIRSQTLASSILSPPNSRSGRFVSTLDRSLRASRSWMWQCLLDRVALERSFPSVAGFVVPAVASLDDIIGL